MHIGDHKCDEARLAERNAQLDLAGKIARIGSFTYDHATQKLQLSPGCTAIYGLPEGTLEISREDWRALVHPDDLQRLDAGSVVLEQVMSEYFDVPPRIDFAMEGLCYERRTLDR